MSEMKISKKANLKVYNFTQAIKPDISKNTSYDEAWEIIANYGDLWGEMRTLHSHYGGQTKFILTKNDKELHQFTWPNKEVFDTGDWDWTKIYQEILEWIIDNKVVKKPRKKRNQK